MTDQQILQELEGMLEALGIQVRHEALDGSPGGMCTVNGSCCMFLDTCGQPADLARQCAGAVMGRVDVDTLYLKPEVRRYLRAAAVPGRFVDE